MATVYLKGGNTAKVSLEELENYLYENQQQIEIRRKKLRKQLSVEA